MKEVISASRRTDMPAHYLDRLTGFIQQGFAEVRNPYSGKKYIVSMKPEVVHTLVLWSKNFKHLLENTLYFKDYNLYFLFTINNMPELEPSIPGLDERLDQMEELAVRYGPQRIAWRYDPVIFKSDGPVSDIETFLRIGVRVAATGVTRTIFSFLDMYGKVKKRNEILQLHLVDPPLEVKMDFAKKLAGAASECGLSLESCCEDLEGIEGIVKSSCINGRLLSGLAGEPADITRDSGQRKACNCTVSRDIGSYSDMPCPNGCLYCYANPDIPVLEGKPL